MLLTIRAWNDKKKQFFFTAKELENYVASQNISMKKYIVDKKYQLDRKHLEQVNIVLTGDQEQDSEKISDVVFPIVEKNILKKLNISLTESFLMECSVYDIESSECYREVASFYKLIKCILKEKSLTDHLKPTKHYVLFRIHYTRGDNVLAKLHKMKSFQIPIKCDNTLLYYVCGGILGNFMKIDNQRKYNNAFIVNQPVMYLGKVWGASTAIVKGNCVNNEKSVLEIDRILFILEYINNEINIYLESLPVSDVVKEYLFAICKNEYYKICKEFLSIYFGYNASKTKYKSLSDIKYKS